MEKTSSYLQNILLICGIIAFIIYIGADILAGKLWHNYSFIYQSKSELSALGSPARYVILPFDIIYSILIFAFGLGIWRSSGGVFIKITASLIIVHAVINLAWMFFPKHLDQTQKSFANSMNAIFGAISLFLFLFAILFGAIAYKNWFRFYSVGALVVFIILTLYGVFIAPKISVKPYITPVGLQERIMIFGCLLWGIMLAINQFITKK